MAFSQHSMRLKTCPYGKKLEHFDPNDSGDHAGGATLSACTRLENS